MNRKHFISQSLPLVAGLTGLDAITTRAGDIKSFQQPEPIKMEIVKEFVGAGHGNIERVKEMLANHPNLLYSRYDWGNGDFEEAIEGAGHVGNKEIAELLIKEGARLNLFVMTMLGKTSLVKPILETYPDLIFAKGAHGFTLLHHARKGGDAALELHDYLLSKNLKETQFKLK
jgi:hypothetical protein